MHLKNVKIFVSSALKTLDDWQHNNIIIYYYINKIYCIVWGIFFSQTTKTVNIYILSTEYKIKLVCLNKYGYKDTNTVICTLLVKWTKTRLLHMKSEICIKWIYATSFCFTGFINSLLSLGFWVPLSNISFACYLTHPVFIIFYIGLQETPIHYTDINFVSIHPTHFVVFHQA